MRRSGITWDAQALDAFLADPQKAVPANRMPYAGLTDAAARADLVAYLEKATKP
jgi:cytochrome c